MKIEYVPGGICIQADLFSQDISWQQHAQNAMLAIADPPYGKILKNQDWDRIDAKSLALKLVKMSKRLEACMASGSHLCLWGGFGTPNERAFYRTILGIEDYSNWNMAEHITWRKKRAYGTKWRCLAAREEMARFVLGDIKRPACFNPPLSSERRGYSGFNKNYPAKSEFKRLTMVWDHASDMTRNKPHECFKPPELAETQIQMCTNPGQLVLDLFAGSAQVSLSARELGRSFVCVESSEIEFDKIINRLKN